MPFKIEIETKARLEFLTLPKEAAQELLVIFEDLKVQPEPPGALKLSAAGDYRIRRGQYRILYSVDAKNGVVRIYKASRRRYIYNRIGEQLYRIRTGTPSPGEQPPPKTGP